jgi:CheY-like chemotaxis protein
MDPSWRVDGGRRLTFPGRVVLLVDEFSRKPSNLWEWESDSTEHDPVKSKVLVVDDERLLADTTADILRGAGFHAKTAYDGWAALETARSFRPDYLVTDIVMPMLNGVELAIAITKMFPATKILLFSGQAGIIDIVQESRLQGYEFPLLAKPVHPLRLIERLKNLKSNE